MGKDIQNQTQEQLKQAIARIKSLYSAAPIGLGLIANRCIIEVNDMICEMLGYERNEIIGQNTRLLYETEEEYVRVGEIVYDLVRKFGTGSVETKFKRKDGKFINVIFHLTPVDAKKPEAGITFAVIDITQLRKSQAEIKSIFKTAPIGLGIVANRIELEVNDKYCEMLGYERNEMVGHSVRMFYETEEEYIRVGEIVYDLVRKFGTGSIETKFKRKDGKIINVILNLTPVDAKNPDMGTVFAVIDITQLRQSQAKIESIFKAAPIGLGLVTNRVNIEVNDKYCEILGYERNEIVGQNTRMLYETEEEYIRVGEIVYDLMRKFGTGSIETKFKRKDGKIINVIINLSPLDAKNPDAGITFAIVDITQLRKSQAEIESIFKAAPVGIGMVSNRFIVEANDLLCKMTGYAREEMIGQSSRILYSSDEEFHRVGKIKYDLIKKFGTGSIETKWRCKDGRIIDVLLSSTPLDTKNHAQGVTFTALDITQQKKAQFSLRLSEQRFRNIANYTYNWETWLSNGGTVLWVNPGVERITGYSVDECMRMKNYPACIAYPEDADMVQMATNISIKGDICDGLEFRIIKKDGTVNWVSLCSQQIYDLDSHNQGVRISIHDIDKRKKTDLALHGFLKFTAAKFGKQFFDSLVTQLAHTLEADLVLVGQFMQMKNDKIQTISVFEDGKLSDNFEYSLKGTPCLNVIGKKICCYKSNVVEHFPDDTILKAKGIEAYVGAPLFDSFSAPLGIIAILYRKPLTSTHFIEDILELFASRTAAEIERNNYEKAFINRLNFEDLISDISASFIDTEPQDVDNAIESGLEMIANFAHTDSAYVFLFDNNHKDFSMTHLWHNKFAKTQKHFLQNLSTSSMPWWMSKIASRQPVIVSSIDDLPEFASFEKRVLESQNIKSFVDVPLIYKDSVIGFLGLGSTMQFRQWTEDDLNLLKTSGQIIIGAILRKQEKLR
jgi:PAS domain S-box-containing protein